MLKQIWRYREIQAVRRARAELSGQAGQVGIIILLLTIVLLTIGLSIASRSVTDVRLSRQEQETSRAFDAAEAGIEDALRQDLGALVGVGGSVDVGDCPGPECITADYSVDELQILETKIDEGVSVEVNLVNFTGSQVSIEWAQTTETSCPDDGASVVVSVFNPSAGTLRRTPYKGCNKVPDDYFENPDPGGPVTPNYEYRVLENVDFSSGDEFMRVRAVYDSTWIRIDSSDPVGHPLPAQLWTIHSEAQTTGGETRAVEVTQTVPAPPSIFDFVLFSGSNLIKN
jgi:Tfp pilus assembly protein PilX